jgi:hypothetical protein
MHLFGPCEGGGGPDAKVTFAICGLQSGILQLVCMVDFVAFSSNSKCLTFICVEEKISIGRGGLEVRKIILHSGCISLRVYHLVNLCVVSKRRDLRVVDGVGEIVLI